MVRQDIYRKQFETELREDVINDIKMAVDTRFCSTTKISDGRLKNSLTQLELS